VGEREGGNWGEEERAGKSVCAREVSVKAEHVSLCAEGAALPPPSFLSSAHPKCSALSGEGEGVTYTRGSLPKPETRNPTPNRRLPNPQPSTLNLKL